MERINFESFIGKSVLVHSSVTNPPSPGSRPTGVEVIILGVEAGGLWAESQVFTDMVLKTLGQQMTAAKPIAFLPFSSIAWVSAVIQGTAISSQISE